MTQLKGVILSVAQEVSIEGGVGGSWPSSFETSFAVGGNFTSDSEEDETWERLSTDSSDGGSSSDGDWNKGTKCSSARLGARRIRHARDRARQRGSQPKFFEWDRRKEGFIEDLSGGMEKNVRVQVCVKIRKFKASFSSLEAYGRGSWVSPGYMWHSFEFEP